MSIEIRLNSRIARLGILMLVGAVCAILTVSTASGFVVGTLSDQRALVSESELQAADHYFPNSARLIGRLAEAEVMAPDRDLAKAERTARQAISLSPNDFSLWMVMAAIKEGQGDRGEAERAFREASRLAPANSDVQWRLANLMLREGRTEESLDSFRIAVNANRSLMSAAMELVWRYSKGRTDMVTRIVPSDPPSRIALARFLVRQSRTNDALSEFAAIESSAARTCPASWEFLRELMATGDTALARGVWMTLAGQPGDVFNAVYNAGFEQDPIQGADQFDWKVTPSDAAQVFIDPAVAHSGSRSLRIEFAGHDTTRLDGNIGQLTVMKPGAHYKLHFYWRTENLVTTGGPVIALSSSAFPEWTVKSSAIPAGTRDWQQESIDFVAPGVKGSSPRPMTIGVVRTPKLHYEAPMRGVVWLDDFTFLDIE